METLFMIALFICLGLLINAAYVGLQEMLSNPLTWLLLPVVLVIFMANHNSKLKP